MTLPITNLHVAEYRNYLSAIVNDRSLPRGQRMLANHKLKIVESLVMVYEDGIGEDNLFWLEAGDPALPEDIEQLIYGMQRDKFTVINGGMSNS